MSDVYTNQYFYNYRKSRPFQSQCGEAFARHYNSQSIIDMGCGCGWYVEGFFNAGVKDIVGTEFSYDICKNFFPKQVADKIIYKDLSEVVDLNRTFDIVVSLEVGEHLLEKFSEIYIANLVRHAENKIIFSVATRGVQDDCHVNIKPLDYWLSIFRKYNFTVSDEDTKILRSIYKNCPVKSVYKSCMSRNVLMMKPNN